eukprot:scaffold259789_cov30-Tisochrysis_lutea.AAC.2
MGVKAWLDALLRGTMVLMAPAVFPVQSANALTFDAFASTIGFLALGVAGLHPGLPDPHVDPTFITNACFAFSALATLKLLTFSTILLPHVADRYPCMPAPRQPAALRGVVGNSGGFGSQRPSRQPSFNALTRPSKTNTICSPHLPPAGALATPSSGDARAWSTRPFRIQPGCELLLVYLIPPRFTSRQYIGAMVACGPLGRGCTGLPTAAFLSATRPCAHVGVLSGFASDTITTQSIGDCGWWPAGMGRPSPCAMQC